MRQRQNRFVAAQPRRAQQRPTVFTSVLPLNQLPDLVREDTVEIRLPLSDYRTLRFQDQSPDVL